MFLLVSFGFESLPLPVPYSSFESRHPGFFFRMPGKVPHLSTLIILLINSSGLYKTEGKARVEAQTKGERKSRKGGRSLVLVLTETSLSNFHFWVVSLLFGLKERQNFPFFLFFLFYPFDGQRSFFILERLDKKFQKRKNLNKGAYAGRGPTTSSFRGGD